VQFVVGAQNMTEWTSHIVWHQHFSFSLSPPLPLSLSLSLSSALPLIVISVCLDFVVFLIPFLGYGQLWWSLSFDAMAIGDCTAIAIIAGRREGNCKELPLNRWTIKRFTWALAYWPVVVQVASRC